MKEKIVDKIADQLISMLRIAEGEDDVMLLTAIYDEETEKQIGEKVNTKDVRIFKQKMEKLNELLKQLEAD